MYTYMYIYIYRERERYVCIHNMCIYIYIHDSRECLGRHRKGIPGIEHLDCVFNVGS